MGLYYLIEIYTVVVDKRMNRGPWKITGFKSGSSDIIKKIAETHEVRTDIDYEVIYAEKRVADISLEALTTRSTTVVVISPTRFVLNADDHCYLFLGNEPVVKKENTSEVLQETPLKNSPE